MGLSGRDDRKPAEDTLARVYHARYARLCAVAAAVLGGDRHLAQDAVQEAWLRLNAPGVREKLDPDPDRLAGLLLVTVRNAARNLRRGSRELTLPEEGWAVLPDPAPGPTDLTPDALKEGSRVTYPAADCYYVVDYFGVDLEDVCAILGGME